MPVRKCDNGKWRIGEGPCIYKSKASAEKAYGGYMAAKHMRKGEGDMTTTSGSIAVRNRRKQFKRRKKGAPGMRLRYKLNASAEDLDALVEQAVLRFLENLDLKGA